MEQSGTLKTRRARKRLTHGWRASRTSALILLLVLAQILLACSVLGGGDPDPYPDPLTTGSDAPVAGTSLACSQECADRGQCGTSTDRGRVVLLGAAQPSLSPDDFDLAVPEGSAVTVLETRSVEVQENLTGSQFPINFYRVLVHDRNVEGWVAAWCILNP